MNNLDYTIGWFTDWLDRVCVGKKKSINVHLPCGKNRLKRGKKLFIQMAIEAEKRSAFIRFVVTDGYVDTSPSEDRIAIKPLKEHLGFGVNSMLISENHEVVLQKMSLQELESRKDLMRDYDIFVTDFTPHGDYNNDVIFPFDEYITQRLSDDGLIVDFDDVCVRSDKFTSVHQPTKIQDEYLSHGPNHKPSMTYDVWKKGPDEVQAELKSLEVEP